MFKFPWVRDNEELGSLRQENAKLRKQIKSLEHQLCVQRAKTGDQKSMVKHLRSRLTELTGDTDPIKTVRQELGRAAEVRHATAKERRTLNAAKIKAASGVREQAQLVGGAE